MNTEKRDAMNILVTLDANYIPPLTVMLSSMLRSNPGERFNVYVANSSLTTADFDRIRACIQPARCRVINVKVDPELLKDAPVMERISKETYYRLVAMDYLPAEVKKILYIDPDTVVINSLRQLYDTQMGDALIMGSSHVERIFNGINTRRLKMPRECKYINAGVLLMNIEGIRGYVTSAEIFDYIAQNAKKLYLADQDVINALFCTKTLYVDARVFNLDEKTIRMFKSTTDLDWVNSNCVIVHFNGKYKPWKEEYKGVLKGFYDREYAVMNENRARVSKVG